MEDRHLTIADDKKKAGHLQSMDGTLGTKGDRWKDTGLGSRSGKETKDKLKKSNRRREIRWVMRYGMCRWN